MSRFFLHCIRWLVLLMVAMPAAAATQASNAAALHARHAALAPQLVDNAFRGPIVLESVEGKGTLQGDVHAVVEHSYNRVKEAFGTPDHWCDAMILHLNNKHCRRNMESGAPAIELRIGKKFDQPVLAAQLVVFAFRTVSLTADYMAVEMQAPGGPFGTNNYRLLLEAVPLEGNRTFIHMGYSFDYGALASVAMQAYLSTVASDKVGFTTTRKPNPGESPDFIGGLRGLVERNTMRYYLAIDAYLGPQSGTASEQMEKRFRDWFNATERYPRQLHEIDRDTYVAMKRKEYERQQSPLQ
jgi:hypothetical protein